MTQNQSTPEVPLDRDGSEANDRAVQFKASWKEQRLDDAASDTWFAEWIKSLEWYEDIVIHGEFDPVDLAHPVRIGGNPRSVFKVATKAWPDITDVASLGYFLSRHQDQVDKDGPAFIVGELDALVRKDEHVLHADLVWLDLDDGTPVSDAVDALKRGGILGFVPTTHSHMVTQAQVTRGALERVCKDIDEPTLEDVKTVLSRKYLDAIVDTAESDLEWHTGKKSTKSDFILVDHSPVPKVRIVVPIHRFALGSEERRDLFKAKVRGVAARLGFAVNMDPAANKPSQPCYFPAHRPGAPYEVHAVAGEILDLDEIEEVALATKTAGSGDRRERNADSPRTTMKGLGNYWQKYGKRLDIARLYEETAWVDPSTRGSGGLTGECPNADDHTDSVGSRGGFFCINGKDHAGGHAFAFCSHNSCSDLKTTNFIELMCQGVVGLEDARALQEYTKLEQGDPPFDVEIEPEPFTRGMPEVLEALKAYKKERDEDGSKKKELLQRIGASGFGAAERDTLKDAAANVGIKAKVFNDEVKVGVNLNAKARAKTKEREDEGDPDPREIFNERHAVVVDGKDVIFLRESPQDSGKKHQFFRPQGMKIITATERMVVGTGDAEKEVDTFDQWVKWEGRRVYEDGVAWEPRPGGRVVLPTQFNVWNGFPVKGKRGDWTRLRGHLLTNVCQGNEEHFNWVMSWCAHIWQFPGVKLGSALVIVGEKGTGKSKLADWLFEALGGVSPGALAGKANSKKQNSGDFNELRRNKLLWISEEATWSGDHSEHGKLKDEISSDVQQFEPKGVDARTQSDYCRKLYISNDRRAVPADIEGERRFMILECGNGRRQDKAFFSEVDREMREGGMEAMVHEFLTWPEPAEGWDVLRTPPETDALKATGREGLSPGANVMLELAENGEIRYDGCKIELKENDAVVGDLAEVADAYRGALSAAGIHSGPAALRERKTESMIAYAETYLGAKVVRTGPKECRGARKLLFPPLAKIRAGLVTRGVLDDDEPQGE